MKKRIIIITSLFCLFLQVFGINNEKNLIYNLSKGRNINYEELLLKRAADEEFVRIMVDLKFKSEKNYTEKCRIESINKELDKFIDFVKSNKTIHVTDIKRSNFNPWLSLTVNKAALKHLFSSSLIKKIQLQVPYKITLNESTEITQADIVWETLGFTGGGQTIVILDTGVEYEHDFFGNRVVDGACFSTNAGKSSL